MRTLMPPSHSLPRHASGGRISLVGAGPGDPDLLTVRAVRALGAADVVVHDGLVDPRILDLVRPDALLINVAKRRDHHSMPQAAINALLVAEAQSGQYVVRLKGGDPFIFGRGGEEMEAAHAAGVPADIVPGITAALGCAAGVGMPLTHRELASSVTFVAGQKRDLAAQDWRGLAGPGRTLVIYMGLATAADTAAKLMADGQPASTPVAIIENGARPEARVLRGRLDRLADLVRDQDVQSPALIVVGAVAAYAALTPQTFALPALEDLGSE